jgi:hypothetical protein
MKDRFRNVGRRLDGWKNVIVWNSEVLYRAAVVSSIPMVTPVTTAISVPYYTTSTKIPNTVQQLPWSSFFFSLEYSILLRIIILNVKRGNVSLSQLYIFTIDWHFLSVYSASFSRCWLSSLRLLLFLPMVAVFQSELKPAHTLDLGLFKVRFNSRSCLTLGKILHERFLEPSSTRKLNVYWELSSSGLLHSE